MPDAPETILAFDFGKRRIGVAVGQQVTTSASPLTIVANGAAGPDWNKIADLVAEWRPNRLIVGMPTNADGSAATITLAVTAFVADLARFALPIDTIDERYSSLQAEGELKSKRAAGELRKISKEMIDAAAATLIAERWLKKEF